MRKILKRIFPDQLRQAYRAYRLTRPQADRECPICGFTGPFGMFGVPPRIDAECPSCHSLERHRQFMLWLDSDQTRQIDRDIPVLHFAPENLLEAKLRERFSNYRTADLFAPADLKLDLENLDLPDGSVGMAIANHVFEHVDDRKACAEIMRVLQPGGRLVASVPMVDGWAETYENPHITSEEDRLLHFGQKDHLRYFGADFTDRVQGSGLTLIEEFTAAGSDVIRYGLRRGEKLFVFQKR